MLAEKANDTQGTVLADGRSLYIPSLDGLRAFAFLLVFVAHNHLQKYLPSGFGVTIFFFLSGYLITTLLRMEAASTGTVSLASFYLRRILRIFPPFYLVMAVGIVLTLLHLLPEPITWKISILQAIHLSNYAQIFYPPEGFYSGSGVLWSLSVEEHFYLLFPLFYLLLCNRATRGQQAAVMAMLCVAELVWRNMLFHLYHPELVRLTLATDTRFDSILYGCILAVWMNPVLDRVPGSTHLWGFAILPVSLMLLLISCLTSGEQFRQVWRPTVEGLLLAPVFISAIKYPDWPIFRVLNLKWIRHLGLLSYTLYLIHDIVLEVFDAHWHAPLAVRGVIAFLVSLLFAEASYRAIERPAARLRKQLHLRYLKPKAT